MSDVPETPDAGAAEAAQGAVEHEVPETAAAPPWGEDFNPERAWNTIQNLRAREKELSPYERQLNELSSDPDAAARFLAEKHGFEFAEDEPDYDDTLDEGYEDPHARDLAELKAWKSDQERQQREAAIAAHVGELTADADLSLEEKQLLFGLANTPDADEKRTEKIVKEYLDRAKAREEAAIQRYLESKRAPAPPQEGKAGEPAIDPFDTKSRIARMAAGMTGEGS